MASFRRQAPSIFHCEQVNRQETCASSILSQCSPVRSKIIIVSVAVALGVAFLIWWMSPTQVLKRRITNLIEEANVPAGMGKLGRNNRGPEVSEYMTEMIDVVPPSGLDDDINHNYDRETVSRYYSALAHYCKEISSKDLEIEEINVNGEMAEIYFRMDLVVDLGSRRPADGIMVARTTWKKLDGTWLLEFIEWTEEPR